MKLPHVRLTVRRLMVAVAIVAILIGVGISLDRRQRFLRQAEDFAFKERLAHEFRRAYPNHPKMYHHDNVIRKSWEIRSANSDFYASMSRKYERAAHFPWLSVEPDPPEPE